MKFFFNNGIAVGSVGVALSASHYLPELARRILSPVSKAILTVGLTHLVYNLFKREDVKATYSAIDLIENPRLDPAAYQLLRENANNPFVPAYIRLLVTEDDGGSPLSLDKRHITIMNQGIVLLMRFPNGRIVIAARDE